MHKLVVGFVALLPLAGCASNDGKIHPRKVRACKIMAIDEIGRAAAESRYNSLMEQATEQRAALGFEPYGGPYPNGHVAPEPVSRVAPVFPTCAVVLEVEGECEVYFDIGRKGAPTNIFPLCSSPVFDTAARQTVARFQYRPATIDGEPVVYPGANARLVFALQE